MIKTVGFAQLNVTFGKRETNFASFESLLSRVTAADLIVLPELVFTGYDFKDKDEVASLAETRDSGPTAEFLSRLAAKHDVILVAGYPELASGQYFNSAMMVTPVGDIFNYRKIHLFSREHDLFSPGDAAPKVYETSAGRIGMMICFDWFFPETARLLALAGAQIIAHPSNLVLPYCQRAMFTRSVENHVYSITANRLGTEDRAGRSLTFTGASQVVSPIGETLVAAQPTGEDLQLVQCDVSIADNKQINPYNNLIESRRTDLYGGLV